MAALLRGKACWSMGQDAAGLPRQSWGHPLSQSHFPPLQNDGTGRGECEGSLKHPGAIMWVYQKQLTLESAHSWVPIRTLPPSISVSKVLLPCSLEHHEPLPARSRIPSLCSSNLGARALTIHSDHTPVSADKEANPAGAGGNQAAREGWRRGSGVPPMASSSLSHTMGRTRPPRNPGGSFSC